MERGGDQEESGRNSFSVPSGTLPEKSVCIPSTSQSENNQNALVSIMKSPGDLSTLKNRFGNKRKKLLRFEQRKKTRHEDEGEDVDEEGQRSGDQWEEEEDEDYLPPDNNLEKKLEEDAMKNNLSTINVKSILHHVITNEHFQAFMRKEEGKAEVELDYEPKLTRSKVKSVVEAEEPVPVTLWPISPLKKPPKEGPQFAELAFSEDSSDDEDYKPDQDDLNKSESDYESLASHLSDLGSPYQSIPSLNQSSQATPQQLSAPQTPVTPSTVEEESQIAPANNTEENFPHKGEMIAYKDETNIGANEVAVSKEDVANTEEMLAALRESNSQLMDLAEEQQAVADETIAKRTRSKFPIEQPLEEIEAQFVAPDATKDLYDVAVEDEDWQKWLASLFRDAGADMSDGNDDDQNDPEFNYLAEQEKMPKDMEDYRNDRAVRISKKELGELLTEVMAEYGDTSGELCPASTSVEVSEEATVPTQGKGKQVGKPVQKKKVKKMSSKRIAKRRAMLEMSQAERDEVQQQLQQHVQLLSQLYLLTRDTPRLQQTTHQSQHFLNELNHFANVYDGGNQSGGVIKKPSCFRVSNLEEAVNIVNQPYEPEVESVLPAGRVPFPIPENSVEIMATSKVFMYPELLPTTGCPLKQSKKVVFTEAEDKLVVLGLEQFKGLHRPEELIVEHMLPIKTEDQIVCRIKNCVSSRSVGNIIKDYKKHKLMPKIKRVCKAICKGDEKPPVQMMVKKMPPWLEKFLKQHPEYGERPNRVIQPKIQTSALQIAGDTGVQYLQVGPNSEAVWQQTPLGSQVQDTPSKGEAISVDLSQPQSRLGSQLSVRALDKKSRKKKKRKSFGRGKSSVNSPLLPANAVIAKAPPLSGCIITVNPTGGVPMITINTNPQLSMGVPLQGANQAPTNSQVLTVNSTMGVPGSSQNEPKSSPSRDPRLQMLKRKRSSPAKRHAFAVLKSSPKGSSALRQYRLGRGLRQKYQWTNAHRAKVRKGLNFGAKEDKELMGESQNENEMDFDSVEENSNLEAAPENHSPGGEDAGLPDGDGLLTNPRAVLSGATYSSSQARVDGLLTDDGKDRNGSRKRTFDGFSGKDPDGNIDTDDKVAQSKYDNESAEASRILGKGDLIEEGRGEKEGERNTCHESDAGNMEDVEVDVTGDEEGVTLGEMHGIGDKGHMGGVTSMKENIHPETGKASTGTLKFAPKRGKRRKLVTKKMRNKMKRDSEIRKKLLDPQIMETDEQKEGREIAFSKMFLQNAKKVFQNTPNKYVELLNYFKDFSEDSNQGLVDLCEKVFTLLEDHPKLILQFTAFLPLSTARELKRLQESLEFVKVRLFLRQVEVYFSKQQSHYQKIISTILDWEEDQLPPAAMLKENILPLLKGQPQLLQSFLCLFADEEVKDPANSRFEVLQLDSSDKQHDSYEEIDFTDNEEEQDGPDRIQPLLKSRRVVVEVEDDPYAKPRINFRRRTMDSPKGEGAREVESDAPSEDEGLTEKKVNDSSQAVSHLSQMCDNLADYLNENVAATEDEDIEVDTEMDTELDTEMEDGDIDDADTEGHEADFDQMISGDSMDEGAIAEGDKGPEGPDVEKYTAPDSHGSKEEDIDVDGEEKPHLDEASSPLGSSHDSKHSKQEELSDDVNVLSNASSGSFASVSNENSQDSEYESSKVKSAVKEKLPVTENLSANEEEQDKTLTCSFETLSGSDSEKDRTLVDSAHEHSKSPEITSELHHVQLVDVDCNPSVSADGVNTEGTAERTEKQIERNETQKAGIQFTSLSEEHKEAASSIHLQDKGTPCAESSMVNKNEMFKSLDKQVIPQGQNKDSSPRSISSICPSTSASKQSLHESMRPTESSLSKELSESMEGEENNEAETSSLSSIPHDECSQISANNLCVDGSGHVIVSWSRETDQFLLQCVRENHDKPDKFEEVARRLKDKTPSQVESRYNELMSLFHAMQDGTDDEEVDQTDGGERSSQSKASTTDHCSP